MKRRLIYLGAIVLIVGGFILVKAPTPPIAIAAEPIKEFGGYTVTNTILSFWVIIILMAIIVGLLYRSIRNVEEALVPQGFQNVMEALFEAFFNVVKLVAGEKNGRRFFPVVAGIFIILLFSNWFGLFPWNNAIGRTVDLRFEHLEVLEEDGEDILADINALEELGKISVSGLNRTFEISYYDPIPFEVAHFPEANEQIGDIFTGHLTERERAVREIFAEDPIPADTKNLHEAIEDRFVKVLDDYPASAEELELVEAHDQEEFLEKAIVFNLLLPPSEVTDTELKGAEISGGGVNFIPIKASDFEYDPYLEPVVVTLNDEGAITKARLYDTTEAASEDNPAPGSGELVANFVTLNTTHLGIFIKLADEGVDFSDGVGEIFPFFRAIATDLNLPLAIALWSFIFVQLWGIQSLGLRTNYGKYLGLGGAAVVKGPVGVLVGFLEIISEISRIVSFTFRLFGNIIAGEIVLFMSAFLVPFVISTVFYGLEVFVGFIQAFVFAMLTLVFAVTAISHGAHEEDEAEFEGEAADH